MKRLPMRKIQEVLRLSSQGISIRQIATSLRLGRTSVRDYLHRAKLAGISWPLPMNMSEADLEKRLFPSALSNRDGRFVEPNWADVHRELKRRGVTLSLLWEEYRELYPNGYGYSRYCDLYRRWEGKLSPVMRQRHPAGERLFVDYAGTTVPIHCKSTGEVTQAQIFVATLGASNYTFVEATATQKLADWVSSHVRALDFFGGAPAQIVPDNLKSGVTKACFYDPEINRTYAEFAAHYEVAIIPARPNKPKDKSLVEAAVGLATRWIIAKLRNRKFFSLAELNEAIRPLLYVLNDKQSKHLGASRQELFEQLDKPALRPLPGEGYVYAEWVKRRAGADYHIEIAKHFYSVPHQLIKRELWVRVTTRSVEVFHAGRRVASHTRTSGVRGHSTLREHMPPHHRYRDGWTPQGIINKASKVGVNVATLAEVIMRDKRVPEQGYRSCLGIIKLADKFGATRLDDACLRALEINARSYKSVQSILQNGLDRKSTKAPPDEPAITHANIRGAQYFH